MSETSLTDRLPVSLEIEATELRRAGFEDLLQGAESVETAFICRLEDGTTTRPSHRPAPVLAESTEKVENAKGKGSFLSRVAGGLFGSDGDEVEEARLVALVTDARLLLGSTVAVDEHVEYSHDQLVSTAASGTHLTITYTDQDPVLRFEQLEDQSPEAEQVAATLERVADELEAEYVPEESPSDTAMHEDGKGTEKTTAKTESQERNKSAPEASGGPTQTTESAHGTTAPEASTEDVEAENVDDKGPAVETEPTEGDIGNETEHEQGDDAGTEGERFAWLAEQEASMATDPERHLKELEAAVCRVLSGMTNLNQAAETLARVHTGACLLGAHDEGALDRLRLDALVARIDDALGFIEGNEAELAVLQAGGMSDDTGGTTPGETAARELLTEAADVGFTVTGLAAEAGLEPEPWTLDTQQESAPAPREPAGPAQSAVHERSADESSGERRPEYEAVSGTPGTTPADAPARSPLTELYEAFYRYKGVLDAIVAATDDGNESPTERWCEEVTAVINGGDEGETGYGSQQASRAPASASEYRDAYGDGEVVTSFAAIEVSTLPDYIGTALAHTEDTPVHGLRPHAPETGEPLPILVESEAELRAAKRLLSEFPEEPPVGYP